MEDNPPPPSQPREWVCGRCREPCSPPRYLITGTIIPLSAIRNQTPQRPEQPPEEVAGHGTRNFFAAKPHAPRVELGIEPGASRNIPDDRPPTFYQFLPLPENDKPGQNGS